MRHYLVFTLSSEGSISIISYICIFSVSLLHAAVFVPVVVAKNAIVVSSDVWVAEVIVIDIDVDVAVVVVVAAGVAVVIVDAVAVVLVEVVVVVAVVLVVEIVVVLELLANIVVVVVEVVLVSTPKKQYRLKQIISLKKNQDKANISYHHRNLFRKSEVLLCQYQ